MRKFWLFGPATLLALMVLGGCASNPAGDGASVPVVEDHPRYLVDIFPARPPVITRDGFDAGLTFYVTCERDLPQEFLVQELTQTLTYEYSDGQTTSQSFTLVECFRLRYAGETLLGPRYTLDRGQFDRHFQKGLRELSANIVAVRLERTIHAYVADVEGADLTSRGFAQLERNESGKVVSNSPESFNETYRKKHQTRGQPRSSNHAGGVTYEITYRLERMGLGKADFAITHARGNGRVFQSSVVVKE